MPLEAIIKDKIMGTGTENYYDNSFPSVCLPKKLQIIVTTKYQEIKKEKVFFDI